jgi:hypothetical protein
MFTKRRMLVACAAILLGSLVVVVGAIGASDSGTSDQIAFKTGANASTPSGSFIDVPGAATAVSVSGGGPLLVRFSAEGSVRDLNSGGSFAGHHYAVMFVRVLVNGVQLGPVARFFDNTGKVGVRKPRAATASYEWAKHVTAGVQNVKVQFKNLHAFDDANIDHFTLTTHFH